MRYCKRCGSNKDLADFYPSFSDNGEGICIECIRTNALWLKQKRIHKTFGSEGVTINRIKSRLRYRARAILRELYRDEYTPLYARRRKEIVTPESRCVDRQLQVTAATQRALEDLKANHVEEYNSIYAAQQTEYKDQESLYDDSS